MLDSCTRSKPLHLPPKTHVFGMIEII